MKKKILQTVLFLGIMFLTFYTLLHGQNLSEIYQAVKKYVSSVPDCSAGLALFLSAQRQHDLVSAHIHAKKKQTVRQPFSVLLEKKRYVLCGVVSIFVYWIFLFGHHTIRNRWAAGAALLYEQRWKQRF